MLQCVQIGLVTSDLPGSLQLYAEAFGYRNAGAQCSWGSVNAIQGVAADSRHVTWWMVGDQAFFQMEIFSYSGPTERPLPADWRPCDHGWTRFGLVIADFDGCLKVLHRRGIKPIAPAVLKQGLRRVAIRDPYVGAIIEIIECDPRYPRGPVVTYVTSSVSDLESARRFYADTLQLEIGPLENLHSAADEALWGLSQAERVGFLAKSGDIVLEIVQYHNPPGRPKPEDHDSSDQGIMNIALGARHGDVIVDALRSVAEAGLVPPKTFVNGDSVCGYITAREREIEFASFPENMDAVVGFAPTPINFFGTYVKADDLSSST